MSNGKKKRIRDQREKGKIHQIPPGRVNHFKFVKKNGKENII